MSAQLAASPIPAHVRAFGSRGPQLRDPEPFWITARFVHAPQCCDYCGYTIPVGSPGSTTGTRGTRAYFNSLLKIWECMGCRQEALRAHSAGLPEHHRSSEPERCATSRARAA